MTIGEIILDEPCPTCGGDRIVEKDDEIFGRLVIHYITCPDCSGDGLKHVHADQEKEDR